MAGPTCRHGFPSLNAAAAEAVDIYFIFYFLNSKTFFAQVRGVDFAQNEMTPRNSLVWHVQRGPKRSKHVVVNRNV